MAQHMEGSDPNDIGGAELRQTLAALHEQGRITLELLKSLVTLLAPKDGAGEGPTLEELLARIMGQLTQVIQLSKLTQSDLERLGKTLPEEVADAIHGIRSLAS